MTIIYRGTKGTDLTPNEVDGNFSDLAVKTNAGWRDMICGLETRAGPSQPPLTNFRNGIYLYAFSPTDIMEAFATAHIDHDYKFGSALYPHLHFSVDSVATGVVRWGFEYTIAQRRDGAIANYTFGPTNTIFIDFPVTGESYTHYVAEVSDSNAIPGINIDIDTVILFRVFRDANHENDTFPDVAFGFTFDLHYQAERNTTPNKVAPFI